MSKAPAKTRPPTAARPRPRVAPSNAPRRSAVAEPGPARAGGHALSRIPVHSPLPPASPLGAGSPLDPDVRAAFEPRLGIGLGHVRVHAGSAAADSARALGASAYTVGERIVFGAGRYAPDTPGGRLLLAHELTHVVQQNGGAGAPAGGTAHERAADTAAASLARAGGRVDAGPAAAVGVQRQTDGAAVTDPVAEAARIMALVDTELAEVDPLVTRLAAHVPANPRDHALAEVRNVAARLEQDERVIADLAAFEGAPAGAAAALVRIRALRATFAPALTHATSWHAANPAGESLGMMNERVGTELAGAGLDHWERGNYVRGAANFVGAFGIAFIDAGETVLAMGFHEAATEVSQAYTRGDISWNQGEAILRSAAWRAILTAAVTAGAGAVGGRLGGLAVGRLGLVARPVVGGLTRGAITGGVTATATLGTQALTTIALEQQFATGPARAIWMRALPSGRDWLIAIPFGMVFGAASGAAKSHAARQALLRQAREELVGRVVNTPHGPMRVLAIGDDGSMVLQPQGATRPPPPRPPPRAEIPMVYDPASGSWVAQGVGGGGGGLAVVPRTPPAPVRPVTPARTPAAVTPVRPARVLPPRPPLRRLPPPTAVTPAPTQTVTPALPPATALTPAPTQTVKPALPPPTGLTPAPTPAAAPAPTAGVPSAAPVPTTPATTLAARRVVETQAALAAAGTDVAKARAALAAAQAELATARLLAAEPGAGKAGKELVREAEKAVAAAQRNLDRLARGETAASRELAAVTGGSARVGALERQIADLRSRMNAALSPPGGFSVEEIRGGRRPNIIPTRTQPGGAAYHALADQLAVARRALSAEIAGLTETVADRVRAATPGALAKPDALANAAQLAPVLHPHGVVPIDVTTGAPMTTTAWAVDHIMPRSEIAKDPRFLRLSPLDQIEVLLGVPENYLPLTGSANSQKGGLKVDEWLALRRRGSQAVPHGIEVALREADRRARSAIDERIRQLLRGRP